MLTTCASVSDPEVQWEINDGYIDTGAETENVVGGMAVAGELHEAEMLITREEEVPVRLVVGRVMVELVAEVEAVVVKASVRMQVVTGADISFSQCGTKLTVVSMPSLILPLQFLRGLSFLQIFLEQRK